MNARVGPRTLGRALGFAGLLCMAGCPSRPKAEERGPYLTIAPADAGAAPRAVAPPGSIALALGGLPPEALARLREHLEEANDAAVRRAAPALFDVTGLDEDAAAPASEPLHEVLPDLPALTAAANMMGGPWSAPGLRVALSPACSPAAARCVPLFGPAVGRDDPLVRRGTTLVWTFANATLLHVPSRSRPALLGALRAAQAKPSGTIALIFDAPRGTLDPAELERLRDEARRAAAHLPPGAPAGPWLDALAGTTPGWELPVALAADEVLVVPRLSALARLQEVHSVVELALEGSASQ
jgi:hypothetical protein